MRRTGHAVARSAIIEGVWGFEEEIEANTVDAFIRHLREKIDLDPYVGNAVPDSLRAKDALRLKKAGIRIVRLAHYPHDTSFVEACDRLGILLYAEPPTWIEFGTDR